MSLELRKYINRKIRVLKHFNILLNAEEIGHLYALGSEISVDNWSQSRIMRALS